MDVRYNVYGTFRLNEEKFLQYFRYTYEDGMFLGWGAANDIWWVIRWSENECFAAGLPAVSVVTFISQNLSEVKRSC